MKTVGIIGYGRFGKVLDDLLSQHFNIKIYDPALPPNTPNLTTQQKIATLDTLFIAVPINQFEDCIKELAKTIQPNTTVIDTCSVKIFPCATMLKHLPETTSLIATHPLFGPDSINHKFKLKIMMHNLKASQKQYQFWANFFTNSGFDIVEISPDEHDYHAAYSQNFTHVIGRLAENCQIKSTPIDTLGFNSLLEIIDQTCNDTKELFNDMIKYNPHTKDMIDKLNTGLKHISSLHYDANNQ